MKQYYDCKDIMKIMGVGKSLAYNIIRKLKEDFKSEYPTTISVQGRVPIWYFNEKMGLKRSDENVYK